MLNSVKKNTINRSILRQTLPAKYNYMQRRMIYNKESIEILRQYIPFCLRPKEIINTKFLKVLETNDTDSQSMKKLKNKLYAYFDEKYGETVDKHIIHMNQGIIFKGVFYANVATWLPEGDFSTAIFVFVVYVFFNFIILENGDLYKNKIKYESIKKMKK